MPGNHTPASHHPPYSIVSRVSAAAAAEGPIAAPPKARRTAVPETAAAPSTPRNTPKRAAPGYTTTTTTSTPTAPGAGGIGGRAKSAGSSHLPLAKRPLSGSAAAAAPGGTPGRPTRVQQSALTSGGGAAPSRSPVVMDGGAEDGFHSRGGMGQVERLTGAPHIGGSSSSGAVAPHHHQQPQPYMDPAAGGMSAHLSSSHSRPHGGPGAHHPHHQQGGSSSAAVPAVDFGDEEATEAVLERTALERQFYYDKLRMIERLVVNVAAKDLRGADVAAVALARSIRDVLYATN